MTLTTQQLVDAETDTPEPVAAPGGIAGDIGSINSTGNVVAAPAYTPAQVAAAVKTTTSATTSPFSTGALVNTGVSTDTAVGSATKSLSTPTPTAGSFTFQGQTYNSNELPPGMTTTPPAGEAYSTVATPSGPVYVASSFGQTTSSTTTPVNLPQGITASTANSTTGAITYTGNGVTLTATPGQANVSSTLTSLSTLATTLGTGYSITGQANGNATVTSPSGTNYTLGTNTISSTSAMATAAQSISGAEQANSAATQSANAQIAAINQQLTETLQTLGQQQDAALGEEGASTGGFGKSGETGVSSRYAELIENAKSDAQDQIAQINADLASAHSTNTNNLTSQLASIEANAQSTAIGLAQTAQTNFTNDAKNFDVSTIQMPQGQTLQGLTVGANGTTGVPGVDALVQQGVAAGYTPQQALQLVQAGVATQNKANQTGFFTTLSNTALANGWANMTPAQLQQEPLFSALVGMAQSYFPQLANNLPAAQALVSGGTLEAQKQGFTETGNVTGQSGTTVPATALPPSATMSETLADTPGATGTIAANTKYTPNGLYQAALEYALTGKTPSLGLGTSAQVQNARAAIVNISGALTTAAGVSLPQLQAEYSANEDALTTILPSTNQTILNATNATTNFNNLAQLASTMDANTPTLATPLLEKWLQTGQIELGSDAATNNFVSYLSTSLTEYAKVVTGQTSGAGVTDTANAQLQSLLNSGLTPATIQSWITNVAQPAMQSRVNASIGQISDISSTIGNLLTASASGVLSGSTTSGESGSTGSTGTAANGTPTGWNWPTQ